MEKLFILTAAEKSVGEVVFHGRKPLENLQMLSVPILTVFSSGKDAYLSVKWLQMNYKMI